MFDRLRRVRLGHRHPRRDFQADIIDAEALALGPLQIAQLHVPSSLRRKTLLIIAITMIGLVGGLYWLSHILLMSGFTRLEQDFARRRRAARVERAEQ